MLKTGGYQRSSNINFVDGSMTLGGGNIELVSNALIAARKDGNAVIFANGKLNLPNQPNVSFSVYRQKGGNPSLFYYVIMVPFSTLKQASPASFKEIN